MAVNKVEFGNETLIDLTEDTVTPETLLNGATAHSANGKRIVGTLIGGTPVVEVSQAEYDALTDEEKAADILYIITDSYPSRELARNVGLDAITGLNATTVQAGIEILTKLTALLSDKVRDCDASSGTVRYANRNVDTNELLLFKGVNVSTKGYISNYLYSTIDSIVASVNTLNSNLKLTPLIQKDYYFTPGTNGFYIGDGAIKLSDNIYENNPSGVIFNLPFGCKSVRFHAELQTGSLLQYGTCTPDAVLPNVITEGRGRTEYWNNAVKTGDISIDIHGVFGCFFIGGSRATITNIKAELF